MFETKRQLRWSKLKVGLVITIAFLVLLVAVFFAGNIRNVISKKIELKIQFKDAVGLRKGAPVWILGVEEGYVKAIHLDPIYGVIVTIVINKRSLSFIKQDSQGTVLTMGLLGDKYIELSAGSPEAGPIRPGEVLKGVTEIGLKSVLEISSMTIETMNGFINRLDHLVSKIESGRGTLAKFVEDPSVYDNLKKTTHNLSVMSEDILNSKGTLKLLLEDPSAYNKILAATSSIEEFSRRINESSGTLRSLIEDPSLYNKTLAAASQIEEFSRKLNEGRGTLKKMIEDPELYENFNRDLRELSSILERIDKGAGLAGALLKNDELPRELSKALLELKKLSVELEALVKDIKEHPKKYFKFSIF
jgi:phospholipid/cholesterol/gamma-HCH transport system substrate-binding protein